MMNPIPVLALFTSIVSPSLFTQKAPMYGIQAWTFNHLTAMKAIESANIAGAKCMEFYPGQPLSESMPGAVVGPDMTDDQIKAFQAQLTKYGVKAVAFGVTGIDSKEEGARKLFTWAKRVGIGIINTESTGSIDMIEKMVKEFDIRVGFHNHPKNNDPNYRMWDPNYVLSVVKDRDKRIGSCADTGHWVRSGIKPVDALKILEGRIINSHLKDLNEFKPDGHDVPYGNGVSDVPAILTELKRQGFKGNISVEYEYHSDNLDKEVALCIKFLNDWYAKR